MATARRGEEPDASAVGQAPEIIVDFIFEQGLLHVAVANIGTASAHKIRVKFDQAFRGLGGTRDISRLRLFRSLEFLPPGKQISSFVDTASAFFSRREPLKLAASISFRDRLDKRYQRFVNHDLSVYTDVSFVIPPVSANSPQQFP